MTINVAPEEITKFDQLANDWWNPHGNFRTLHELNPLRLSVVQELVNLENLAVLDVGCGGGIFSESLAKAGAQVTAIDMAESVLEVAKSHAETNQLTIDYQLVTVETFAQQQKEQFDVITCMEMLEHVPNPSTVIAACASLLKPNGYIFLSTLNRNLKSYLFAIIGAEKILNLLPKGTHDYAKFITPAEIAQCLRQNQLNLTKLIGIHYNPLTRKFSLTEDLSINYIVIATKT